MRTGYHLPTVAISAGVRLPFETSSNVICTEVWFCGTGRRQFSSVELESRENGQSQNGSVLRHLSRESYLRCSGSRSRNAEPGTTAPTCGEKAVGCCLGPQAKIDIPPTCSAALRSVSRAVDRSWSLAMKKLYGWDFFKALAKNNPRVGRSTQDTVTLLSGGECLVGPTWAPGAYRAVDKGNPIAIDQPTDGVVVMVFPSAIPAHAPHPNAARLFLEWMLSDDYSKMIAVDGSEPIREGVPSRVDEPTLDSQKVIALTVEEIRDGVPEVIEQWRDIFGG